MVESSLPVPEQGKLVILRRLEGDLVASIYVVLLECAIGDSRYEKGLFDMPSRSAQNVEYFANSDDSSLTTSNRLPVLLRPCTEPSKVANQRERSHRMLICIAVLHRSWKLKLSVSGDVSPRQYGVRVQPIPTLASPLIGPRVSAALRSQAYQTRWSLVLVLRT